MDGCQIPQAETRAHENAKAGWPAKPGCWVGSHEKAAREKGGWVVTFHLSERRFDLCQARRECAHSSGRRVL